jgi:hypothetical protein
MKIEKKIVVRAAALLLAVLPATALAGTDNQRVAIPTFRGPQAARVQDAVEGALLRRFYLVPDSVIAEAARKSGVRLQRDQDFAELAKSLNVQAFVLATVRKQRNWTVQMTVRKGDTGETVGRFDWSDRHLDGLAATLARSAPRRLLALLSNRGGAAAVEPEGEVARKAPSLPDAKSDPDEGRAAADDEPGAAAAPQPYLELGVGSRIFSRTMSYVDNFSGLPGYRLSRATALSVDGALHPFALIPGAGPFWSGVGLTGNVTYALGIGTDAGTGDSPSRTDVYSYELGVRHVSRAGIVDLIPHASYMIDSFIASGAELAPDVRYQVVRAGMALRLNLSAKASLRASADYLDVLGAGPVIDGRFPRATVLGVDLGLGASVAVTDSLEAQAAVGLRRYGFDMKVQPGDTLIAGGAIDEYLSMTLSVAYRPTLGRAGGRKSP